MNADLRRFYSESDKRIDIRIGIDPPHPSKFAAYSP